MILKKIDEKTYEKFMNSSNQESMYQSLPWYHLKIDEGKKCELLGLFDSDALVGVSSILYIRVLKKYYIAYASRGFVYDYHSIDKFKKALIKYFKKKKVIAFKMDPNIVLAKYDKDLKKEIFLKSQQLIESLKYYGFKHYGFNMAFETMQFRFVHKLELLDNWEKQKENMSKSTKKNIDGAEFKGVKIRKGKINDLDIACNFFDMSSNRKLFQGLSKEHYELLAKSFDNDMTLYIAYVDKKTYIQNIEDKLQEVADKMNVIQEKMQHDNVGRKLKKEIEILNNLQEKYYNELTAAKKMADTTNIAAMITIKSRKEVISYVSGMDNEYRSFNPKYVMYPAMIKDAIKNNLETVNFLGVKNIFDKNDLDYGMYEVKRGFGGHTVEYIGEFDLPINKVLYFIYRCKNKLKGGK